MAGTTSSSTATTTKKMSSVQCCASCGAEENDSIKLTTCDICDLALYCDKACQELHKPEHGPACRKRVAELDEVLFQQPECNHMGDCAICMLPMPIEDTKFTDLPCCSERICNGCDYAVMRTENASRLENKCPFCRKRVAANFDEVKRDILPRVAKDDPVALRCMGRICMAEGDVSDAFRHMKKAADLGDLEAHYQLADMYRDGDGVEVDEKKEMKHLKEAAIAGHPQARHNLGCTEWNNGNRKRAMKHFIIAASLGDEASLKIIREEYAEKGVSKEDFAKALRAYQATVEEAKSPDRDVAEAEGRNTMLQWVKPVSLFEQ